MASRADASFSLTERDREVITQDDATFQLLSWEDLKKTIISENKLELLTRSPSQTRQYLAWRSEITAKYGSPTAYLIQERLRWTPLPSDDPDAPPSFGFVNPTPFANVDDFTIIKNDWPYGMEPGIQHICVWLRTPVDVRPDNGDVTDASRALIEGFVKSTFRDRLREEKPGDSVIWFKNWASLQSIRGIDHIHVLVKDAPEEILADWMN